MIFKNDDNKNTHMHVRSNSVEHANKKTEQSTRHKQLAKRKRQVLSTAWWPFCLEQADHDVQFSHVMEQRFTYFTCCRIKKFPETPSLLIQSTC